MDNSLREKRIDELLEKSCSAVQIDPALYKKYDVKQGLRDANGTGILTGLTEVSEVNGFEVNEEGKKVPCEGQLFYQGYNIMDLAKGFENKRYGFEEVTYLLLFGQLPDEQQLFKFVELLTSFRELPEEFTRDVIMRMPSKNLMNSLQQSILTLYAYDDNAEDISIRNVLRQSLSMIAKMPLLSVYGYSTYRHYHKGENLHIRNPRSEISMAENLLQMLHTDGKYTELEAKVLDCALVVHAEHGGGNNSTFTTHVVSSTGTDSYSAVASSLGSLKGFKHGGANLKVQEMFDDIKSHISNWKDEGAITDYLNKMLNKDAFDKSGLIYGLGHAVYTLSDPRAVLLKRFAERLAMEKDAMEEFEFYERVERIGKQLLMEKRASKKPVCANVDFFSGFVYTMLGIPKELYTPLFATARITGWSAHRIEEIVNRGKIIRPAYRYVGQRRDYVDRGKR